MKRALALILIVAGVSLPAFGAKRVTVEQLAQVLASLSGKPDRDMAWQIGDLQLTERLSQAQFMRLQSKFSGEKSRQALLAIADESKFLSPPVAEIPATATPNLAEQRRIIHLVTGYVSKTIPQLPNFMATRVTTRFEDTPTVQGSYGFVPYEPLHLVGSSRATSLYRDGREVDETATVNVKKAPTAGLNSNGEFGPILATVLIDAAQSRLAWDHWEQSPAGIEGVFAFEVPREKSHYEVNYCCVAEEAGTLVANLFPFRQVVGYSGTMAVDPASGTIRRIAVEASLKATSPVVKAAILVEYGPVEIGGKTYFCPVRSISNTTAQVVHLAADYATPVARGAQPLKVMLNDVRFEEYHMFRAESRVLTAEAGAPAETPAVENEAAVGESATETGKDASATTGVTAVAATPVTAAATLAPMEVPAAAAKAAEPEISVAATAAIPTTAQLAQRATTETGFRLRTTTRLVDIGLVAYDKKGHPVTDLKAGDFEIFDNGRRQEVKYFSQAGKAKEAELAGQVGRATAPDGLTEEVVVSNRPGSEVRPARAVEAGNTTVLMIDSSNLAFSDLTYAREEMLRFLKNVPAEERVGLYALRSYGFEVLLEPTPDHGAVAARLAKWMPTAQDLARAQDEEMRNRQQMEYVRHMTDLMYVNGNLANGEFDYLAPIDPQLRTYGSNPEPDALGMLPGIARHLGAIAGHKSLVWVSSDNALADWTDKAPVIERGGKSLAPLAMRAREALNEAHVSIYPLDASQLEVSGVGADFANSSVKLNPTTTETMKMPQEVVEAYEKSENNSFPGRITAQMQQDTHGIQPVFRELAEATGGRALRRASDIATELDNVAADGRAAYLLSFSPDQPADGKYHVLTVKLAGRRDLTLRYRTGYLYEQEPATLKERFERALWQAQDVNEIGVSGRLGGDHKTAIELNIAGTDLELSQAGDRWMDKLDIFVVDRDDAGGHARVVGQTLGLRFRAGTYETVLRDGLSYEELLPKRARAGSMRVIVVDENSGRMGSITIPTMKVEGR
jgi:VWFA-related protein